MSHETRLASALAQGFGWATAAAIVLCIAIPAVSGDYGAGSAVHAGLLFVAAPLAPFALLAVVCGRGLLGGGDGAWGGTLFAAGGEALVAGLWGAAAVVGQDRGTASLAFGLVLIGLAGGFVGVVAVLVTPEARADAGAWRDRERLARGPVAIEDRLKSAIVVLLVIGGAVLWGRGCGA